MSTELTKLSTGIVAQRDEVVKTINAIVINSHESLLIADNTLKLAKNIIKEAEATHKTGKAPAFEECKKWDLALKTIKNEIEASIKVANGKMLAYQTEEAKRIADALALEVKPHLDLLNTIKTKLLAMLYGGEVTSANGVVSKYIPATCQADIDAVRAFLLKYFPEFDTFGKAKQQAVEMKNYLLARIEQTEKALLGQETQRVEEVKLEVDPTKELKSQEVGITRTWTFKVTDFDAIPKEFLMVDEAKLKEYIRENKKSLPEPKIAGIEFFQQQSIRH